MSYLLNFLTNFPPDVATFLLAMVPIGELRAAIPVGIEVFGLSPLNSFVVSLLGNSVPVFGLILLLSWFTNWCEGNFQWCHRVLERVFSRTERVFSGKYERYGVMALFLLTAIPFPLTGVWTASVAAVIFRIPKSKALSAILSGMIVAGIIVTFVTLGAGGVIRSVILSG